MFRARDVTNIVGGIGGAWEGERECGHVDNLVAVDIDQAEGCACFQSCSIAVRSWYCVSCGFRSVRY